MVQVLKELAEEMEEWKEKAKSLERSTLLSKVSGEKMMKQVGGWVEEVCFWGKVGRKGVYSVELVFVVVEDE